MGFVLGWSNYSPNISLNDQFMRIVVTCPDINAIHGGIRVILEWANRLQDLGHQVFVLDQAKRLTCKWFPLRAKVVNNSYILSRADCLIVTSPHGVEYLDRLVPKKFVFVQMMEHYFRPDNRKWQDMCRRFYTTPFPMFAISQWNIEEMTHKWGRTGPIYYIGNGVNLDHFPVRNCYKDGKHILIESPVTGNPSKDPDQITIKVAKRLRSEGYNVLGYGSKLVANHGCDEYIDNPTLQQLNDLYERATILLKATKMDARSCSPMEAMTKGTVTVRGIEFGDDDLNNDNSFRCLYDEVALYETAKIALCGTIRQQKADKCREYVQTYSWDYWMNQINQIICNSF
jgi:hypothetical protein